MRWTPLLILLLFLLPAVPAQEAEDDAAYTHLYGRIYDFGRTQQPSPMNTMFPYAAEDYSMGAAIIQVYNEALYGTVPCDGSDGVFTYRWAAGNCDAKYDLDSNEVWFYSYNAPIDIYTADEYDARGGLDALPNDGVLLKDIRFDTGIVPEVDFWMSTDVTGIPGLGKPDLHGDLILVGDGMGDVVVNATYYDDWPWPYPMWNGDYGILPYWTIFSKVFAYQPDPELNLSKTQVPQYLIEQDLAGEAVVISEGASEPFTMVSLPEAVNYQIVYKFEPEMSLPQVESIPAGAEIWWWNDWYGQPDAGTTLNYGDNSFAVNSGEFFPPRLSLPMLNPMDIEMVMPQFTDDNKLVVIALFNSPFGAYDVPLDSASFEIINPDGQVIATQDDKTVTWMQKAAREQQSLLGVSPDAALKRGQATWLWNYLAEPDIKPGDYTIRVMAENMQGKAASKEAYFSISAGLGKGGVTSSLGGMFTFSKEDIKKLEECHGCHDAATGELLGGVQNLTMAEAKAMQEAGTLDTPGTDDVAAEKKSPGVGFVVLLGALAVLAAAQRRGGVP